MATRNPAIGARVKSEAVPTVFRCDFANCRKTFPTKKQLKTHKEQDPNHEYCRKCDINFGDWESHIQHRYADPAHADDKVKVCPICGAEFKSTGGRAKHITQQHPVRHEIVCFGCGKHFAQPSAYIGHIEADECPSLRRTQLQSRIEHKSTIKKLLGQDDGARPSSVVNAGYGVAGSTVGVPERVSEIEDMPVMVPGAVRMPPPQSQQQRQPQSWLQPRAPALDEDHFPTLAGAKDIAGGRGKGGKKKQQKTTTTTTTKPDDGRMGTVEPVKENGSGATDGGVGLVADRLGSTNVADGLTSLPAGPTSVNAGGFGSDNNNNGDGDDAVPFQPDMPATDFTLIHQWARQVDADALPPGDDPPSAWAAQVGRDGRGDEWKRERREGEEEVMTVCVGPGEPVKDTILARSEHEYRAAIERANRDGGSGSDGSGTGNGNGNGRGNIVVSGGVRILPRPGTVANSRVVSAPVPAATAASSSVLPRPNLIDFPPLSGPIETAPSRSAVVSTFPGTATPTTTTTTRPSNRESEKHNLFRLYIWDPNHPKFDPDRLYDITERAYVCPHPDCDTTTPCPRDIANHLVKDHIAKTDHRCPECRRTFKSVAALVAHVTSLSAKCRIRHRASYGEKVSNLTGGFVNAHESWRTVNEGGLRDRAVDDDAKDDEEEEEDGGAGSRRRRRRRPGNGNENGDGDKDGPEPTTPAERDYYSTTPSSKFHPYAPAPRWRTTTGPGATAATAIMAHASVAGTTRTSRTKAGLGVVRFQASAPVELEDEMQVRRRDVTIGRKH